MEQEYRDIVSNEVRNQASTAEVEQLNSDLDLWFRTLVDIKKDIEVQISERRAHLSTTQTECLSRGWKGKNKYLEAKAEHDRWRAAANRFKRYVEKRLTEVKVKNRKPRGPAKYGWVVFGKGYAVALSNLNMVNRAKARLLQDIRTAVDTNNVESHFQVLPDPTAKEKDIHEDLLDEEESNEEKEEKGSEAEES